MNLNLDIEVYINISEVLRNPKLEIDGLCSGDNEALYRSQHNDLETLREQWLKGR